MASTENLFAQMVTDLEKGDNSDQASTSPTHVEDLPMTTLGEEKAADEEDDDPNVVSWDGPNDPQNPQNWPESKKWRQVLILSIMTIITPLGSSIFAPGVRGILAEFHDNSEVTATFLISIYVLGFAFGPLFIAPLSETYGRAGVYQCGNMMFSIFAVGAALSNSISMLLAFRFLMGLAGAVPLTIGSGSIADIIPVERRGSAMSVFALGPLLGPCIGPVAGGYLIAAEGWRWVYWLVLILSGTLIVPSFVFMNETYAPVLLERKAAALRRETGNLELRSKMSKGTPMDNFKLAIVRPFKLLVMTPLVTLMALYVAITYGVMYLLDSTFAFVYSERYGFGPGLIGLAFIPAGIGMIIGVGCFGYITDAMVRSNQAKGFVHKPEVRISPKLTIPCGITLPVGLFIYGWTTQYNVHWIVPMLGVSIFAGGLMGVMMSIQNYLLDSYLQYAASVTAAMAVLRSLAGALLPLGGLQMYDTLGLGWGNSLLAFVSLALIPIPPFFYFYGERLREKYTLKSL